MEAKGKTQEQLLEEIKALQARIAELEKLESERKQQQQQQQKEEEGLKASENKYRILLENLPQKIFLKDRNSVYLSCNENYARDLKIGPEEIAGKTDYDFYPQELAEKYRADDKKIMESGKTEAIEEKYIQDGKEAVVHTVKTPVRDTEGKVAGILGIFWDITEQKNIEAALQENEERFRAIFDNAQDGILLADVEAKRFSIANPTICSMLGYTLEEVKNLGVKDIHPEQDLPYVIEQFERQLRKEIVTAKDIAVKRKDGSVFYADVNSFPVMLRDKRYLLGIYRDITERKQAEEALRASVDRYRSYIEVTGQLGWTTNADGEVGEDIPSWRRYTGQSYEEVKGWGWSKAVHSDDLEYTVQIRRESVTKKSPYEVEYRLRRHDGIYREFLVRGIPVFKEDGSIREWVGTCIDITERKKAEEEVKKSSRVMKSIIENSPFGVYIVNGQGGIDYVNPTMLELSGATHEQFKGMNVFELPTYVQMGLADKMRRGLEGEHFHLDSVTYVSHFNQKTTVRNFWGIPLLQGEAKKLLVIVEDMTDFKQTEESLKNKITEIERLNKFMLGREERVVEMKQEVNALLGELGREGKYHV